jgi:hypothetical protein
MVLGIRWLFKIAIPLFLITVLVACAVGEESGSNAAQQRPSEEPADLRTTPASATPKEEAPAATAPTKPTTTATAPQTAPEPTASKAATQEPIATSTTEPGPTVTIDERAQEPYLGIWISREEIERLPTSGPAWEQLLQTAGRKAGDPDLNDKDDPVNVRVLAKALVFARLGEEPYRDDVIKALDSVTYKNSEKGGNTLALGRELVAYVIAADLINLPQHNPQLNADFENRLRELLDKRLDGRTLRSTHEERANNWGTHAGASRAAVTIYLGDKDELQRTADVFKGWLGDRESYDGFIFGDDLSWQCDPAAPVSINPAGCQKDGQDIGGTLPEEMRRGGEFRWPPEKTGYTWEALQGASVQAEILHRAGFDAWEWEEQAILRAVQFLYEIGWEAESDDEWQVWLMNYAYCTAYPTTSPTTAGKNMAWTDWTHGSGPCRR